MHVLIVDDDRELVGQVAESLQNMGFLPLLAYSVPEAELVLSQRGEDIHVALIDMYMGTDPKAGLKLINLMRNNHPQVVSIVFTGYANFENAAECIEAGAFQYLPKEKCPPELLLQTVRQACNYFSTLQGVRGISAKCEHLQKLMADLMEDLQRIKDEIQRGGVPTGPL